jgi:predicted N-formylglutamate amidohydrolase
VEHELRILFGRDDRAIDKLIDQSRQRAVEKVTEPYNIIRRAEIKAFGARSYFYCEKHSIKGDNLDDNKYLAEEDRQEPDMLPKDPTVRYMEPKVRLDQAREGCSGVAGLYE